MDLVRAPSRDEADMVLIDRVARFPAPRWFLGQFRRWGWLPPVVSSADDDWLAEVYRLDDWRKAADALGIVQPKEGGVGIEG